MNAPKESPLFRIATLEDVVFIARLIKEFYGKAGESYEIPYDHESTLITIDEALRYGVCIVGPTSCAAAKIDPFPNNYNHVVARVVFWCFRNRREIVIIEELMRLCQKLGATEVAAASQPPKHVIGRYYERMGLKPAETIYLGQMETCCKSFSKRVRDETVSNDKTTNGEAE